LRYSIWPGLNYENRKFGQRFYLLACSKKSSGYDSHAVHFSSLAGLLVLRGFIIGHGQPRDLPQRPRQSRPSVSSDVDLDLGQDPIRLATREYWMRRAIGALDEVVGSPCPFAAFGAVIVNHTTSAAAVFSEDDADADAGMGEEVCIGANSVQGLGNPTLHGMLRLRLVAL
jgi:hypothetical protein